MGWSSRFHFPALPGDCFSHSAPDCGESRRSFIKKSLLGGWFLLTASKSLASDAPVKIADGAGNRAALDLSGEWDFRIDALDVGRTQKWFAGDLTPERKINVPGAWNAQGAEFPSRELLEEYEQKFLNGRDLPGAERESDKLYHVYPGPAWYRRTLTIPSDWTGRIPWLVFDGVHREAEVWVNGRPAGSQHSYLTPLRIDLSPFAGPGKTVTVAVRVDARRNAETDPLMGCLDTLDFLYLSWGGIYRKVTLESTPRTWIEDIFVVPQLDAGIAEVRVGVSGADTRRLEVAVDILGADGATVAAARQAVAGTGVETRLAARIPNPNLWSPRTPYLYGARVSLLADGKLLDRRTVRFGMREFRVEGGEFLLNGQPIFLRGCGDDCIFPNTICPPSDKAELYARLAHARDYGFNYVRHHSWTPPEEYMEAADELGMLLQPEFPFAYGWMLPKTAEAKNAALEQWKALIRLHRNHPSIATWCMGNEQYDSFDLAPEMYRAARELDPTRPVIDSDGCGFKHKDRKTLDFMVVQFNEGGSIGFQDKKYDIPDDIGKPVMAHEMGYFVSLPDLTQLGLFKQGLRPYWLIRTKELAESKGIVQQYPEWLQASYRLQAACLKSNLEAARRSRLGGTSVWLFQDYPNCAEGVTDMFFRPKAFQPEEFRRLNAPTVLLLDTPRRSWWSGESAAVKFLVSRFEDAPSEAATLRWSLRAGDEIVAEGARERLKINSGGIQELVSVDLTLPRRAVAERLILAVELEDENGRTQNSWDLWVFPNDTLAGTSQKVRPDGSDPVRGLYPRALTAVASPTPADTDLLLTTRLGAEAIDYLNAGGRVILLDPEPAFAMEKTGFRASSWDGGGPSGTVVNREHPALEGMPSEGWCDLQFFHLLQDSKTISLDSLSVKIQPLVRCIDRPDRFAERAYLFEAAVGKGKLLVSGFNFVQAVALKDPAGIYFLARLVRYALGTDFAPAVALAVEDLNKPVKK